MRKTLHEPIVRPLLDVGYPTDSHCQIIDQLSASYYCRAAGAEWDSTATRTSYADSGVSTEDRGPCPQNFDDWAAS